MKMVQIFEEFVSENDGKHIYVPFISKFNIMDTVIKNTQISVPNVILKCYAIVQRDVIHTLIPYSS